MMKPESFAVQVEPKGLMSSDDGSDKLKDSRSSVKIKILGIDITELSQTLQFIVVASGVLIVFVFYGYILEAIFTEPAVKPHALYVTFLQFGLYSIFALIETRLSGHTVRRISMKTHNLFAFLTVATMGLSNGSLEFLNYPTQVIFKSCKMIPMLVGGILIQGKKYGRNDFAAATLMCVGLVWFTLVDVTVSPNFHPIGVLMVSLALLADMVISNTQEKTLKKFGASTCEVVLYSHSIGLIYLLVALVITGRFFSAIQVGQEHPLHVYGYGFLFALTGYLGLNMLLTLLRVSGAFAVVTVTTCRKALTMAVSFMAFSKPFSMQYVWSGLLVLIGVYWSVLSKRKTIWDWRKDHRIIKARQSVLRFLRFLMSRWNSKSAWQGLKAEDDGWDRVVISPVGFRRKTCAEDERTTCDPYASKRLRGVGRSSTGNEVGALSNLRTQRRMKKILERVMKDAQLKWKNELSLPECPDASTAPAKQQVDFNQLLVRLQKAKYPGYTHRGV